MTAQLPDELENHCPPLDLDGLELYGVVRGDITTNHGWGEPYAFQRPPGPADPRTTCSALWRGHVATFRVDADARVTLVRYAYPTFEVVGSDIRRTDRIEPVGELLTGTSGSCSNHASSARGCTCRLATGACSSIRRPGSRSPIEGRACSRTSSAERRESPSSTSPAPAPPGQGGASARRERGPPSRPRRLAWAARSRREGPHVRDPSCQRASSAREDPKLTRTSDNHPRACLLASYGRDDDLDRRDGARRRPRARRRGPRRRPLDVGAPVAAWLAGR